MFPGSISCAFVLLQVPVSALGQDFFTLRKPGSDPWVIIQDPWFLLGGRLERPDVYWHAESFDFHLRLAYFSGNTHQEMDH